jgi:hypothetical protein
VRRIQESQPARTLSRTAKVGGIHNTVRGGGQPSSRFLVETMRYRFALLIST